MRLWLLVALVARISLAVKRSELSQDEIERNVFRTWNNGPVRYIDDELVRESKERETHSRSKRSITSMAAGLTIKLGWDSCQTPGYTGEGCRYPICPVNNEVVPNNPATDGLGATIDKTYLANCTQEYLVYIDDTMYSITFELEAEQALNPYMTLMAEDGSVIFPDSEQRTPSTYTPFYFSVPYGKYRVSPSADLNRQACVLTIRARTSLNVVGGFVSYGDDQARNDFPVGFAYEGLPATAVFHGNGLRSPAKLITVAFTGNDNSVYRPTPLETRYNCSYEYFRDGFFCKKRGSYLYHVDGITFEGYSFRRTYGFECLPPPPTEAPTTQATPSTTPPVGCKNNGFQINQLDGTTTCFCQGLWGGTDCSQRLCMNGGTLSTNNTCSCPTGYTGEHCENIQCIDNEGYEFDAEHPTLILVLRVRANMNSINQQVVQAAEGLFNSLQFDPGYLNNFILVLFNNDQLLLNKRYTDFVQFDNDLNAFTMNSTSPDGDCYDSVFSALSAALVEYPTYKSPVYIVTDAPPKDSDVAETVFHQDSFWRAPLHFIYVQPDPLCIVTPEDPSYRKMDDISKRTGGQTFYLRNRTRVYDFLSNHMSSTVYRSQLVLSNDVAQCNLQNSYQAVTVDTTIQMITVVATGENLQLLVTMPHGDNYSLTTTNYDDQGNFIWTVNGPHPGLWTFTVITTTPGTACNFRIFQKFYNNLEGVRQLPFDLFWAFASTIQMNGYLTQPVYGVDTEVVLKLSNYPPVLPQYTTAGLNIYANRNGQQVEVYASNGVWRDFCDYNFYFPSFTCYVPNEILYFNFYARDEVGMAIQRAGTMFCSEIQPTLNPPTDCQNGGVPNGNSTDCFCPMGYTGSKCQQIVCFNGGTAQGTKCLCPINWTGSFCEFPRCTDKGITPESQLKYVDMIFAVEVTSIGAAQINFLNQYFGDLLRDIVSQDPKWIHRFVLTGFNSTWADVVAVATADHYQDVVDALQDLVTAAFRSDADKGCNVQMWRAFDVAVMKRDAAPGSYMQLFVSSTPDNSDVEGWNQLYEYQRSMNLHLNAFLGVKSINNNPKGYYCNATDEDFYGLGAITGSSSGELYAYDPARTGDIIRAIPLQFYSQIVFNQYADDCTYGVQWYFPIDAYVQTIQLDVYGQNPVVSIYDQDGNEYDQLNIVTDSFSGLMINEVRKQCDNGWTSFGQYCYYFYTERVSWGVAKSFCHQAGGQLADDMNSDMHNFIMSIGGRYIFWLGLFNNGTNWYWDRADGSQPVVLQTDPVYWESGGPPTDPTLQCVYYDGAGGQTNTWVAEHCSVPQFALCQKHRYDQNFNPDDLRYDDLPDGKWSVSIKTNQSAINPTKGCGLTLRVQSELQIFTGYAQSVGQDFPDQDPYRDSSLNRIISYIHSMDNEFRTPFLSMAYLNDAYNHTFYNAARYQERVSCAYPWVTQTFDCPNAQDDGNEFMVTHSGEDSYGNMFQRITYGHCSRTPLTCGNGGYRWNGQCICNEYWQGRYCTVPVCVNNGTLNSDNTQCLCPAGFTGFNCQLEMCDKKYTVSFTNDGKTLIILLENTVQNQGAITALANNFSAVLTDVDPNFFQNYILGTFDSKMNTQFTDYETVGDITNALKALNPTDAGACSMPLYSAINAYLMSDTAGLMQWPNSEMLLITAAGAAGDSRRRDDLLNLADQRLKMSYIYNSDRCGSVPPDGSVYDLVRTAYTTNGNAAFLYSSQLINYLAAFLPSRYAASTLTNPTVSSNFTCVDSSWLVQVDSNTSALYVALTVSTGDLGAVAPSKNILLPEKLYSQDSTRLYRIGTRGSAGIYSLNIRSPGDCFASIWSVGGAQVTVFYGSATDFSNPTGSRVDGSRHSPTAFVQNVLTAHVEGSPGHRAHLQYVEIYDVDANQLILQSEMYRRDGPYSADNTRATCQFEYVSDPFTCDADLLGVYVYGMDENYIQFRSQLTAYCINSTMTTTSSRPITTPITTTSPTSSTSTSPASGVTTQSTLPPTTSYGNKNLVFDVVFIVDMSQADAVNYDTISKFIQTLMLSYTVRQDSVRIALVPVQATSGPTIATATFNSITSQVALITYLNQMTDYGDFTNTGQYVQSALNVVTDVNFLLEGYRSSISNHLIVYITSTSTFSDNPTTANILSSGQYGVITIGYGSDAANTANLQALSGGAACTYNAATINALNTDGAQMVRDLIWAADSNGGKYCGM